MAPIIERLIGLISVPQGNLIYALVLGVCSFAAWLGTIYAKGNKQSTSGERMHLGLVFLFLAQVALFGVSWLAYLGEIDGHLFLPPLDRTLALFSLVLVIWLWAVPEPSRVWDALAALAEVFILLFGLTGMLLWLREGAAVRFNISVLGGYAYYIGLALVMTGLVMLAWRRPKYWVYGFLMLAVLLVSYITQSFTNRPVSDYALTIHLGEMVAFVFLLLLPKRLVGESQAESKVGTTALNQATTRLDGKLMQSVIDFISEPEPDKYYQELTRLVALAMDAEYCLLVIPPKVGEQLIIPVGYNRMEDVHLDGFTADGRKMPGFLEAVKNGKPIWSDGGKSAEARALAEELGIKHVTHLLATPFQPRGSSALMAIALLSNPSAPAWGEAEGKQLKAVSDILLANIGVGRLAGIGGRQEDLAEKLQRAEAYTDQVRLEYAQLRAKYDSIAAQVTASTAHAENEKALEEDLERLEIRNRELESMLARGRPSMEEVEQLRLELRAALTDLARIPTTLSKSDQKMLETQLSAMKSLDKMQPTELVTSIAQEFRQPLSAIVGYTDLLLSESVGLLGAIQRKFLERVKASTERLGILLSELVEVVTIDGGGVDKTPVSVELTPLIQESVGNITAQLDEKDIAIQLDLPETLPSIQANRDAVLQILENLLENACLITPSEGCIILMARVEEQEGGQNFIRLSVTDQGGGIDRADISRVFLRRYKMENPQIKGVGDMGVGLSIVKSLVDLLKGRVWVDSQASGATFSVLLPLIEAPAGQLAAVDSSGS